MTATYQIGQLARAAGVPVETVRYYESTKLLPRARRTHGNYRQYTDSDLERLTFIRHCRSLDMSIDEIRQLLRAKDNPKAKCGEVNSLLDEHISQVELRLQELQSLQAQLVALRDKCHVEHTAERCGILNGISELKS